MYINSRIELKENGRIDGKSLAGAILSLQSTKGTVSNLINSVTGFQKMAEKNKEFKKLTKKRESIYSQINKKVYSLKGANERFDALKIENLKGKFHPKNNYEKRKVEYETFIDIPEFSMKRGDIVLLSGDSGAGKSTILNLLRYGDIKNKNAITLDNKQKVDYLGNEFIAFDSNTKLGSRVDVLYELTHSKEISELDEKSKNRLLHILQELHLDVSLEELKTRRYLEFSEGQRKRLDIASLFYRMGDATSVVIADEPFANVQKDLIKKQMQMLIEHAKKQNIMLLFTTHDLEHVPYDLITKHYKVKKINDKESKLEQVELEKNKKEQPEMDILEL